MGFRGQLGVAGGWFKLRGLLAGLVDLGKAKG